ncbi:condensation domain-containing protein [Pseudomonas aeruginosa]|nr:condensation domain-containing protein [Pseudomonas aeruginosa]
MTLNTLVRAAWSLLLQRYTGRDTVVFGATVAGRPAELAGIERQIGLFINTLPVVATPQPGMRLTDWLQEVQAPQPGAARAEHTPLFEIQRWAGLGERCSTACWYSRTTLWPKPPERGRQAACASAR